eukprot:126161-Heterocapsa_arctica.AAC.1
MAGHAASLRALNELSSSVVAAKAEERWWRNAITAVVLRDKGLATGSRLKVEAAAKVEVKTEPDEAAEEPDEDADDTGDNSSDSSGDDTGDEPAPPPPPPLVAPAAAAKVE